jgi:hypothetical protein
MNGCLGVVLHVLRRRLYAYPRHAAKNAMQMATKTAAHIQLVIRSSEQPFLRPRF